MYDPQYDSGIYMLIWMQGRIQGAHPARAPLKLKKIRFFGV